MSLGKKLKRAAIWGSAPAWITAAVVGIIVGSMVLILGAAIGDMTRARTGGYR